MVEYKYDPFGRRISKAVAAGRGGHRGWRNRRENRGNDPRDRIVGGWSITRYVYDGLEVIEEYASDNLGTWTGTHQKTFVHGVNLDEHVAMERWNPTTSAWERFFYLQCGVQGSVGALAREDGSVVEYYTYRVSGEVEILGILDRNGDGREDTPGDLDDNPRLSESAFGNEYLFTGQRYDYETGLYYFKARYYNARWGCFISRGDGAVSWVLT